MSFAFLQKKNYISAFLLHSITFWERSAYADLCRQLEVQICRILTSLGLDVFILLLLNDLQAVAFLGGDCDSVFEETSCTTKKRVLLRERTHLAHHRQWSICARHGCVISSARDGCALFEGNGTNDSLGTHPSSFFFPIPVT